MRYLLIPLILALAFVTPGCQSDLELAPGLEAYQTAPDPVTGDAVEKKQGVRFRVGSIKTETAPNAAAEKASEAAGKFKEGSEANVVAAEGANKASLNIVYAAVIVMGGLIALALLILIGIALLRRKD